MLPSLALLCGGRATRLFPRTHTIAKSMIDIHGEPFIAHQMRWLHSQGIQQVVLCAGIFGEQIQNYLGNGARFDLEISYAFDGPSPLGTGGAILQALSQLSDPFFVMYGDSYLLAPLAPMWEKFEHDSALAQMAVYRNEKKWDSSNVYYEANTLVSYEKKNRTDSMQHIDYGISLFRHAAFKNLAPHSAFDLADHMQTLVREKQMIGYEVQERFYEIGSPQGLTEFLSFHSTENA